MTSEPDSTPRRRPPTIDLTATEVAADKPAAGNDPTAEGARTDGASGQQSTEPAAGGLQNLRHIAQHAIGLRSHVAGNDLLRSRINGDLARREHKSVSLNSLRVRADRQRSVFGGDDFAHKQCPVVSG